MKAIDELVGNANTEEVNADVVKIGNLVLERFKKGDSRDMKEISSIGISKILSYFKKLFERYREIEKKDIAEEIEAIVLTINLKSENLLLKTNAIDTIKSKYGILSIGMDYGNISS
jgi:lipid A disaccharide synthetase